MLRLNRRHAVLALLMSLICGASARQAAAVSFTFDFQDPDAVKSQFNDAVPVSVQGAWRDTAGKPIGFTHVPTSDDAGRSVSNLTLGDGGLAFRSPQTGRLILGLPFLANGWGRMEVTVRFDATKMAGFSSPGQKIAVGWGLKATRSANDLLGARMEVSADRNIGIQYVASAATGGEGEIKPAVSEPKRPATISQMQLSVILGEQGAMTASFEASDQKPVTLAEVRDRPASDERHRLMRNDGLVYLILDAGDGRPEFFRNDYVDHVFRAAAGPSATRPARRGCQAPGMAWTATASATCCAWWAIRRIARPRSVIASVPTGGRAMKDASDVVVQLRNGRTVPTTVLSHDLAGNTIIQFLRDGAETCYWVYFGAKDAQSVPPDAGKSEPPAEEGLVGEYRRWEGDSLDSWPAVQTGLKRSTQVIGNAPVAEVLQNESAVWPDDPRRVVASYRGFLRIDQAGTYRLFANSDDAAFVFIDGELVEERTGDPSR